MMIGGICESPLTYRALIAWRDALNAGKMLLRDIIDLDATYGGGARRRRGRAPPPTPRAEARGATPTARRRPRPRRRRAREAERRRGAARPRRDGRGRRGQHLARRHGAGAASRAVLGELRRGRRRPTRSCEKLQQKRLQAIRAGEPVVDPDASAATRSCKAELVELMRAVRLNNSRIEQLVDAALRPQPPADGPGGPAAAPGRRTAASRARTSCNATTAPSSTRTGWRASRG